MADFWQDLRYGARVLLRKPVFTISVVLSLTLAIGLNSAIFTIVDALLLRPLPGVREVGRLAAVYNLSESGPGYFPVSYANYKDFRARTSSFSGLAAGQGIRVALAAGDQAETVAGEMVTANYFDVLGARMALGRGFLPEEDTKPGGHPVVVIGHDLWSRRFASDSGALGRKIRLNGLPFTVIGVAERGFRGTSALGAPELWVPTMMYPTVFMVPELFEVRSAQTLQPVGRLRPGVSIETAEAEMRRLAANLEREFPDDNRGQSVTLVPLAQATIHPSRRQTFVRMGSTLMVVVVLLLLMACVNVVHLLLVRALSRGREFALRLSLGAERRHLIRQLLIEGFLLAFAGGAASLLFAHWTFELLWRFRPPFLEHGAVRFSLDARALGFAGLLCVLMGIAFGLAPALWASRANLFAALRESKPGFSLAGRRLSSGDLLIFLQVALCSIGLTCAGLFLRSLWNARQIDPGFSTRDLLLFTFDLQSLGYGEERGRELQGLLLDRLGALPGVERAALGENRLLGGFRLWRSASLPGHDSPDDALMVGSSLVGPGYFETVGIRLRRGRAFDPRDREGAPPVAVVNETMAKKFWPDRSPVGERLRLDDEEAAVEVVGVVADSKYMRLGEETQPFLYLPLAQRYSPRGTVHLRTAGDPAQLVQTVRREVSAIDRMLPVTELRTISEVLDQSLWAPRMSAAVLSLLSFLALALSVVGIYGVTAYGLARRRLEIGVRIAMGAGRTSVVNHIFRKSIAVLAAGAAVGLAGAFLLNRWIASLLYGVAVGDLSTFAGVLAVLLGTGALATLIPTVQACRIEPVTVLRDGGDPAWSG